MKFYIKPQPFVPAVTVKVVVSYWNSTSNHNKAPTFAKRIGVVSYWNSTSNHNKSQGEPLQLTVVSYWNSTSNHNSLFCARARFVVVSYWNSTSNHNTGGSPVSSAALYLIEILHQTTTQQPARRNAVMLYLIEILHQTTTACSPYARTLRCILLKFYIKPQRRIAKGYIFVVVSYWNSTSNHNAEGEQPFPASVVSYWNSTSNHNAPLPRINFLPLYLIEILHQTTTSSRMTRAATPLYLIEILHQTTTLAMSFRNTWGCILLKFYIKPQHWRRSEYGQEVVSYWNSTSNHNCAGADYGNLIVVSYWNSTSNHNQAE